MRNEGGTGMISKSKRKLVYDKYNGCCAYCGCELKLSEMQVDHIVPKFRNNEMWHQNEIGSDEISNLNPSCRMCNYYKGMGSIENFRENLKDTLMRNVQRPFDFRLAERYGMIEVTEWDGKFYFEKVEK